GRCRGRTISVALPVNAVSRRNGVTPDTRVLEIPYPSAWHASRPFRGRIRGMLPAMEDTILVQRDAAIATVVLNRPHKLNALTHAMWQRLGQVFGELDRDGGIRCIVIRGAGTQAFAPGN